MMRGEKFGEILSDTAYKCIALPIVAGFFPMHYSFIHNLCDEGKEQKTGSISTGAWMKLPPRDLADVNPRILRRACEASDLSRDRETSYLRLNGTIVFCARLWNIGSRESENIVFRWAQKDRISARFKLTEPPKWSISFMDFLDMSRDCSKARGSKNRTRDSWNWYR